ncbi:MAG: hypothetical protein ACD_5C00124G0002 [uncultured bacterium]|nr:MAG: hypothetical protein ACD_5C00124G0002 [uncultured bacterium]
MTFTGAEYSTEALMRELKKQVEEENIRSIDGYNDLVDLLVEEKKSYGFFAEDEDLEQLKSALSSRWNEVQENRSDNAR